MSKVYVYTRNSNAEAFEKGSSRETQIKKCRNYASIKDLIKGFKTSKYKRRHLKFIVKKILNI